MPRSGLDACMNKPSVGVQDAIRALQAEETRFAQELEALKRQSLAIAADRKRVRLSLAALAGSGAAKAGLQDTDALQVVAQALATGPLTAEALKAKLLEHAKTSGLSGTGVHLVLHRVLKDQRFQETKDGYGLASRKQAESA